MLAVEVLMLSLLAQAQSFSQTTWTGGPDHFGPTPEWGDTFYTSDQITWNEFPTMIRLTGVIQNLPEHMIDPSIGGWDNDPDVGDLDQDGDLDVIATDESDPDIVAWYENDGTGSFTKHVIDPDIYSVDEAFMIDLDLDGDNDLVVASDPRSGKDLIWYENDGSENFVGHVIDANIGGSSEGEGVFVADLDNDGDLDVLASWLGGGLYWYENDGSQSFTKRNIYLNSGNTSWNIWAADFDGDGDKDVILTTRNGLLEFVNDGASPPHFTQRLIHNMGSYGLWCRDMDKDGDLDIVVSGREYTSSVWWFRNNGTGNFTPFVVDETLSKPMGIHAVDVDPDGDMDIVVADQDGQAIYFYDNQGDMTFVRRTLATGRHFFGLFMGDLDGDADADVLVRAGTKSDKEGLLWYETRLWYDTPGELVSSVLDPGCHFIWQTANFQANTPPGTSVQIWVRSADDPATISGVPWGGPITVDGQSMDGLLDQSRLYFQYRITMSTSDRWYTPTLDSVAFTGYCDPTYQDVSEDRKVLEGATVRFLAEGLMVDAQDEVMVEVFDPAGRCVFNGTGEHLRWEPQTSGVYTVLMMRGHEHRQVSGVLIARR